MERSHNPSAANSRLHGIYIISGVSALALGMLFLLAMLSLIAVDLHSGITNNWLITLFKLNAGFEEIQFDQLYGPNLLDITLMALVVVVYLGLYVALKRTSRLWSMIAAIIPLLGIVIFIVTKLAGRSGVMGAGIVISLVMLRSNAFSKVIAFLGILANVLLLVGDFGTAATSPSTPVAIAIGIGYVLLLVWFFLIARQFFRLGQTVP